MSKPPAVLTVIIADLDPYIHAQLPPTKRSVQIWLTDEQRQQIAPSDGASDNEIVSECFFEPVREES